MGITAIAGVASSLISKLESLHHSSKAAKPSAPATQFTSLSDASSVSNPGMLFSQLQNLSHQNPAEFKKITAEVAQKLQAAGTASASATSPGSPQTTVLNQMASNFQNASKTGSFSDLFTHSTQSPLQQVSTAAASGHFLNQYAAPNPASDTSTVHGIFAQALSQIKIDRGSTAALNTSSL